MKAIYETYRALLLAYNTKKKVVSYGFLYCDTLKILLTTGSKDAILYGHCSTSELTNLELALETGQEILALFCEFPGNPLLRSPDMKYIRRLADQYDFVVVCDDTVGTSVNCDLHPYVDVVVTSLTKMFSGECNVMGGTAIINPNSKHHNRIHAAFSELFMDTCFPRDAVVLSKNSMNFASRVHAASKNALQVAQPLRKDPRMEKVYYPFLDPTKPLYDVCRRSNGDYGFLLSAKFKREADAVSFFDSLHVAKGPSLGMNFTIASVQTLLAHYDELEWAAEFGLCKHLIRISVGLEPLSEPVGCVQNALLSVESNETV
ncbi:PLP-dependent transferase [Stipitochalara longipes BDJ]|nr:PLP-dependent transferase [Stipitochalara longipes BDJ]